MSIVVENISYYYPRTRRPALSKISTTIFPGEAIGVIGPSGSGKSTFCYLLNGTIPLALGGNFRGKVTIDGVLSTSSRFGTLSTKVGLLFQEPNSQISSFTVESELAFGLENLKFPRKVIVERIDEVIQNFEITSIKDRPMSQLSEGEKQIVVLGAIVALQPKILVLDEPHSMIDPKTRKKLKTILQNLNQAGITVIITSHNFDLLLGLVDRIIAFSDGKICADAPLQTIVRNPSFFQKIGLIAPDYVQLLNSINNSGIKNLDVVEDWLREWINI